MLLFLLLLLLIQARALSALALRQGERRRRLLFVKVLLLRAYVLCFESAGRLRPRSMFLSSLWYNECLLRMNSDHFKNLIRAHRSSFDILVERLQPHIQIQYDGPGRTPVDAAKQTAVFLFRCAHNGSCKSVSTQFGVSPSTVDRVCFKVARALPVALADQLTFPSPREFLVDIVPGFSTRSLIPDVGLIIDGCLFNLQCAPPYSSDPKSFISRKMRYAMHALAAVDHRHRFRDILVGFPGSAHDNRVLRYTDLAAIAQNRLPGRYTLLLCCWHARWLD